MDPVYKGGPLGEAPVPSNLGGSIVKPTGPGAGASQAEARATLKGPAHAEARATLKGPAHAAGRTTLKGPRQVDEDGSSLPRAAFEGDLSYFAIPELIQLVCTGIHDVEVSIVDGAQIGHVMVRGGRIFRCALGSASGAMAFFHLARLRSGRFRVTPMPAEGEPDASLLQYSWQGLLLEAARREDEAKRDAGLARHPAKRAEIADDDAFDLFDSTPPPPLPNSAVVERAEEGGQLIPFPRKLAEEPPQSPSPAAALEAIPNAPPSAPLSQTMAPPTLPSASLKANKADKRATRPAATSGSPVSQPIFERTLPSAAPPSRQSSPFTEPPESDPAPLSLQPVHSQDPIKAPGTHFAQLIQDATAAYLRRDYDRALLLFEECLSIDPCDRRVQHNIERIKNRRSRA
jgi:hypothetical protein